MLIIFQAEYNLQKIKDANIFCFSTPKRPEHKPVVNLCGDTEVPYSYYSSSFRVDTLLKIEKTTKVLCVLNVI